MPTPLKLCGANCICMWYPEGFEEKWLGEVIKQCIPTWSESDHALDIFNDKGTVQLNLNLTFARKS